MLVYIYISLLVCYDMFIGTGEALHMAQQERSPLLIQSNEENIIIINYIY